MGVKDLLAKILYYPIRFKNIRDIKKYYSLNRGSFSEAKKIDLNGLKRTLVISPHIDDETIGLGGLLYKNRQSNSLVDLLYMTDSGGSYLQKDGIDIKEIRSKEASTLGKRLGLNDILILDVKNNEVEKYNDYAFNRVKEILLKEDYDNLFIVSPFDAHYEHRWVNNIFYNILKSMNFKGNIYLYEVSNLLPNLLINSYIDINLSQKEELYNLFKSQKHTMDFDIFQQLNRYKGMSIDKWEAVEYFSILKSDSYLKLMDLIKTMDIKNIIPYRIGNHRSFYKVIDNEEKAQEIYKKIEMLI